MRTKEDRQRDKEVTCKHFNGMQHKKCDAGVTYDIAFGKEPGVFYRMPCFGAGCITCEHYCRQTPEELEAIEQQHKSSIERYVKCRKAIVEKTGGKRGVQGSIKCPCCEIGTLSFSVAGFNGHIHAACSTEGCASWME